MKSEHKDRHEKEQRYTKDKFKSKVQLAKDKTLEENKALMEQSVDIDQHLKQFRHNMMGNQLEEQRFVIEEELRNKLKQSRQNNEQNLKE